LPGGVSELPIPISGIARVMRVISKILVMTFPIKKRINTKLFIDKKQGLYTQNDIKKTF